jgi:hypothetical protein
MRPQEIGIAERTEEIAWWHVWLKSVLIVPAILFQRKFIVLGQPDGCQ